MKKTLLILLSVFALSCTHDDANPTDKTALNLVTGIVPRQNFDDTPFQLGNPNVLVNNKFVIYPNPARETLFVTAQENITDVWIVPANPKKIYQGCGFQQYSEYKFVQRAVDYRRFRFFTYRTIIKRHFPEFRKP
jgi:hypothetical protein